MIDEILHHRDKILVRRLVLEPGEALPWHRDPYHRVSVVLHDATIRIEFPDGTASEQFQVTPGQTDWDEPTDKIHRGVNVGATRHEEITVFFLDHPDAVPQPVAEPGS